MYEITEFQCKSKRVLGFCFKLLSVRSDDVTREMKYHSA